MNTVVARGNGASSSLSLPHRMNRISVSTSTWGGVTKVALEYSPDPASVPFHPLFLSGAAISVDGSSEGTFDMPGGGSVRMNVTSFSGSDPITLAVVPARTASPQD